jgi:hypothetical protein
MSEPAAHAEPRFTRLGRVSRIVAGVVSDALRTTGADAVILLDAESAEGRLLGLMLDQAAIPQADYSDVRGTLTAHPINKTALLVGNFIPRVDLLPLGDLYASQVSMLGGSWTGDEQVNRLAGEAGGIEALDAILMRLIEGRWTPAELRDVPAALCDGILAALSQSRFRRARAGLVPKLGTRTIGIDLLD